MRGKALERKREGKERMRKRDEGERNSAPVNSACYRRRGESTPGVIGGRRERENGRDSFFKFCVSQFGGDGHLKQRTMGHKKVHYLD